MFQDTNVGEVLHVGILTVCRSAHSTHPLSQNYPASVWLIPEQSTNNEINVIGPHKSNLSLAENKNVCTTPH